MSKKLIAMSLFFAIFMTSNFTGPKAHALVGLVAKSQTVKVIGGIGVGSGVVTVGSVFVYAATTTSTSLSSALGAVLIAYLGILVGGLGLLILDDNTIADIEFMPVIESKTDEFNDYDIAVYNSELEELNAVRKTIQAETSDDATFEDVNKLWVEYRDVLSPETVAIAEAISAEFVNNLQ